MAQLDTVDLFLRLGLALAIGLLIGLERGWRERDFREGARTAGIRTFALIGLLGGLWGAMTPVLGPIPMAAAGLAFAAALILFEWRETNARNDFSVTSTIAGFVAFALGAFAVLGNQAAAAGAGVATVALLAARTILHEFLKRLTWPELRSGVVLLAMTFLLLPLLPNRTVDPWKAVNPYELWLMTVLIAALAFLGYVAVRILGERRGILASAGAGAIISSTTVTLNNSRLAAQGNLEPATLSVAILIAWIVSLLRMAAIALAVNLALLPWLAAPMTAGVAALGAAAFLFRRHSENGKPRSETPFENPLDIAFVLRFGALLAAVTVGVRLAAAALGQAGVLALAGISGFVDVDPITLSAARAAGEAMTAEAAAQAILLAAAANLVTKMGVAVLVGGARFGTKLMLAGVVAIAAGAAALNLREWVVP